VVGGVIELKKIDLKAIFTGLSDKTKGCNIFGGGSRGAFLETAFVFLLIFSRFVALGFTYYPQLDDYIQYKIYASTPLWEACTRYGLLAARPLSNTADIFLWGHFAGCFILAVLLISIMYAASVVILRRILYRYFGTGGIFTVVLAILPLAFEGTYWLSASTRIVCGLFYASLSALFLQKYLDDRKKRFLPFIAIFQLAAMFSYEQALLFTAAMNIALAVLFAASQGKNEKKTGFRDFVRLYFAVPLTFVGVGIYFAFIKIFSESALYGSSYSTANFFSLEFFTWHIPKTAYKIAKVFAKGGFGTLFDGFLQGMRTVFESRMVIYFVVTVILCILLGFFVSLFGRGEKKVGKYVKSLLLAAWLFLAPTAVFFVMADPYFSMRNAVICLPGLALAADSTARIIFRKSALQGILCGTLAAVCMIGGINEINGYAKTTENDTEVINAVIEAIPVKELTGKIGILNLEESYIDDVVRINEHITGVTSSYWALTGAVNATLDCTVTGKVTIVPLPFETPMSYGWNRDMNDIASFDRIFLYSPDKQKLTEVTASQSENGEYTFFDCDGKEVARAYPDGDLMHGELLN